MFDFLFQLLINVFLSIVLSSLEGLLLSQLTLEVFLFHINDTSKVTSENFHKQFQAALVFYSSLLFNLIFLCKRYALGVLCHKEDFPATGENPHNVSIGVCLRSSSHVLFCAKKLVESFHLIVLINKNYLPPILYHAMASIAE